MQKRRSFVMILLLCYFVFFLQGCEFKDIDKRFFITAMGIDVAKESDKRFRVSLKIAIPKGQLQMGQEDYLTVAMESDSITDAVQKLKATSDKEFDFGHTKVLVIGEALAKRDYRDALDWFSRQRFIQRIAWVTIAQPTAEELLIARQKSERLPANALILAFGGQGVESQYIVSQHLYQLQRKYEDPGENPVLPIAEPRELARGSFYNINKMAVLTDSRVALELTPDETKLYNVLGGGIEKSDFTVPTDHNKFSVHIDKVGIRTKILEGKKPTVQMNVKLDGIVEEEKIRERISEDVLNQVERKTESTFVQEARKLLKKFQSGGVDPVGFGAVYRETHWEDVETEVQTWKKLYPKAEIQVQATCVLRTPGAIQ